VDMWAEASGPGGLAAALEEKREFLNKLLRRSLWDAKLLQGHEVVVKKEEFDLDGDKLTVTISARAPVFNEKELSKLAGGKEQVAACLRQYVQSFDLQKLLDTKSDLEINFDAKTYKLKRGVHFAVGPADATWLS